MVRTTSRAVCSVVKVESKAVHGAMLVKVGSGTVLEKNVASPFHLRALARQVRGLGMNAGRKPDCLTRHSHRGTEMTIIKLIECIRCLRLLTDRGNLIQHQFCRGPKQ